MISVSNDELVVRLRTIAGLMQSGEYGDFAAYIEEAADRLAGPPTLPCECARKAIEQGYMSLDPDCERNRCKDLRPSSTESSKGSGSSSS